MRKPTTQKEFNDTVMQYLPNQKKHKVLEWMEWAGIPEFGSDGWDWTVLGAYAIAMGYMDGESVE